MDGTLLHDTEADWASAWTEALDALELSLEETERLLRGEAPDAGTTEALLTAWAPPKLEGPMPVDLRTRALELHHRQQELMRATADAAVALRKQAALTSKLSTGRKDATPIYLDINA